MSWVRRVEDLLDILKGSSIAEIELAEGELEIILRRVPGNMGTVNGIQHHGTIHATNAQVPDNQSVNIVTPLTGVYYAAPSPTAPPFVSLGNSVSIGQIIALVEAMKVFNEIRSEVAGRVVAIVAAEGNVVKQGDVLLQIEVM